MFGFRKPKTATVDLNIPTRVVVRVVALVILAFIALAAIKQAQHAVILIFTSFFLALALNGPVHWIAQRMPGKRRGSRAAGTAISFLVVILLLAGFLLSVVPPLVRQTTTFISNAPQLIEQAQNSDSTIGRYITKYHLQDQVSKVSTQVKDR
ncbi:MAG TPA: AI-2E family transporter, partial [Patescibacteria group bacterium]|nr:AI-2E family transporter [Patescibacteria group bacterium]